MVRRGLATALVAVVFLAVAGYAAVASLALQQIALTQRSALLTVPSTRAIPVDGLDESSVRTAMAAMPLSQAIANVVMVREARHGMVPEADATLGVMQKMGWRDTTSLQNMLYVGALTSEFDRMLDFGDALLRRQMVMDQMFPVIALVEATPEVRGKLVARLATNPSWRDAYLSNTGLLKNRNALLVRFALIRTLQRQRVRLGRDEVIANINALDRNGLTDHGFALWQTIQASVRRPLDDPDFTAAARGGQTLYQPVPYQWQLMSGEGFTTTANTEGTGTTLDIDWDGRGVPVFAQQRTSASPGRYALTVAVPSRDRDDLGTLVFRLVCDTRSVAFEPVATGHYVTTDTVPCAFPLLQVVGDVQSFATAHTIAIDRIAMTSLGPAKH